MFGPSQMGTVTATRERSYPQGLMDASTDYLTDLLQGDYLHGGPGFDAAMQAAANDIQPRVQSAFNSGGRLNSGLAQEAMSTGLADSFANLYNQERGRQSLAGLQLNPVTETSETPYFGNTLSEVLGAGSSLLGLGQGIFGEDAVSGFFGDLFDFRGSDSGGVPSLPPGTGTAVDQATGGSFSDFAGDLFGGSNPTSFFSGAFPSAGYSAIGSALGPQLTGLANLSGVGSTAITGAPASFSAFSQGLNPALLGETVGAAAGSAPGGAGALSGGLGAAVGAALPLALAGFGAMSVRGEREADRAKMAPFVQAALSGGPGSSFIGPDGDTYTVADSFVSNEGTGRAISNVINSKGVKGTLTVGGFVSDQQAKRNFEKSERGQQVSGLLSTDYFAP